MNELMIYLSISLISLLLFYFWFRRQGHTAEKQWLTQKIASSSGHEQQKYVDALSQLGAKKPPLTITFWVAIMVVPSAFFIDYMWFHTIPIESRYSLADSPTDNNNEASNAPDLATAIQQLEQKLAEDPNDLEGQLLYGRSMMQMQQFEQAVGAYRKANQIEANNPNILVELAEAIAFKNNTGSFLGEPETYLKQAIQLDPQNQKGMWLHGIVLFEKEEYEAAETIWTTLLSQVNNPNIKTTITRQINQARAALNKDQLPPTEVTAVSQPGYFVVIDASEAIQQVELGANARLFVYAKEVDANGHVTMPMPIAAIPIPQPLSWPMSLTMTDQHNLNPDRKLSSFAQVQFSAKLSLSGSATPAAGDLKSNLVIADKSAANIQLLIDQ
ncbi:MAG: tetratricopeptide repeat protein [Marinicella sp.]